MQTETRAYIITMTINSAQCTCKHLCYSLHGRGPSHSTSCIKQSTLRPWSFRKVKKSSRQAVRDACSPQLPHPEPPQHRASTPYTAYNPIIDIQIYRVNDESPAANGSNTFHPRSPLGCWLAYFTLESGRMFTFQRTSAEPLGLAHRTPEVRSNTG